MVFEYARRLKARGHKTQTLFPLVPYWFREADAPLWGLRPWLGSLRRNLLHRGCSPMQPVRGVVEMVPWITDAFVPDAEAVVATAWPTAYSVASLSPRKGVGCYLVQHREVDSGPATRVDHTYRLPLHRIAGSHFTARLLRRELGVEVEDVVQNAIDVPFWSAGPEAGGPRTGVLMSHHRGPRKGAVDGLSALARVHRERPDVPVRLFGPARSPDVPPWVDYVENPSDEALRALYLGARVFLFPSRYEGFGLPALEAMAAGCALVATRVGGIPDFAVDGVTARLVDAGDIVGLARGVLELLGDADRTSRMGASAAETARPLDLEHATDLFEAALLRAVRGRASARGGGASGGLTG
jgi:glycosyltransferase involved in cell wall biosynthesis